MGTPRPPTPRFLRWLLRLYPPAHRARYAHEMEACFRTDLERSGGGLRFWIGVTLDHLRAAAAVRVRKDRSREPRWAVMLEDLRHAARALRRAPTFTAFATLTLALGIGATTAAFGVLDRVVLRPLPYPGAERMVMVGLAREGDPGGPGGLSAPLLEALRTSPGPAEDVVGVGTGFSVLTGSGEPERVYPAEVTNGFFSFIGARAAAGRLLVDDDYASGAERVIVLAHGTWAARFGGDPSVVGSTLFLDGVAHTVVGVLSDGFLPPEPLMDRRAGDIWVPLPLAERARDETADRWSTIRVAARLTGEARPGELEAHLARIVEDAYGTYPRGFAGVAARDLRALTVGEVRSVLWRVFAAVALLLAVACVNVASLLLTRGSERARELAVRSALGAGRGRLVRQLLAESLLLGLLGGAVGAAVAFVATEGFRRFSPGGIPRLAEVAVDGRALAFSVAVALAAVVVFGLLPARRAAARSAVVGGRQSTPGPVDGRLRGALVLAETALAVVLVVGSGLLAHDLVRRAQEDPGYRPEGLIAARVALPYGNDERSAFFWRELVEGASALPTVTSVTLAAELPTTDFEAGMELTPEGHDAAAMISTVRAGRDFQAALGLEVVEGGWFSDVDRDGEPVAVVNQAFVDAYWAGRPSAVGRSLRPGSSARNPTIVDRYWPGGSRRPEDASWRVVGVVADTRVRPGVGTGPKVYIPMPEAVPSCCMEVVARTSGDPATLAPALRALVRRLDPAVVDVNVRTVASLNAGALARPRFYTALFSGFGATAFLLALVGVYGTTAYATRARTREIGIRMALGARALRVVSEVVARTVLVIAGGVALGLVAAGVVSRALGDVLLTLGPRDGLTYAVVGALVFAAGGVAALVPAGRAGRVDPALTLRDDG